MGGNVLERGVCLDGHPTVDREWASEHVSLHSANHNGEVSNQLGRFTRLPEVMMVNLDLTILVGIGKKPAHIVA